jgi:hypothetical protein
MRRTFAPSRLLACELFTLNIKQDQVISMTRHRSN